PASITMRPIFNPRVRVRVDCPSRVGVGTLGVLIKSGLLEALRAALLRAFVPLATADSAEGSSFFGLGSCFVATDASSFGFFAAAVVVGAPLAFLAVSDVAGAGFVGFAACNSCGVA